MIEPMPRLLEYLDLLRWVINGPVEQKRLAALRAKVAKRERKIKAAMRVKSFEEIAQSLVMQFPGISEGLVSMVRTARQINC